jgi:hypothetical protein
VPDGSDIGTACFICTEARTGITTDLQSFDVQTVTAISVMNKSLETKIMKDRALEILARRLLSCSKWNGKCWEWTGAKAGVGYGYISVRRGRERKNFYVHRLICELNTGEVGEVAMHSCDNPCCCTPNHIRWGSRSDNTRDMVRKNRHGSHMKINKRRLIPWGKVLEIRAASGTLRDLADKFGVHHSQIWNIKTNRMYREQIT